MLDGLDEVGYFRDEWIPRLVGNRLPLARDRARLARAQDAFADDGAILSKEFQSIPTPKDGSYGQFGEQATRIIEDQGSDLIVRPMVGRTGQPSADARRIAKVPAPEVDQMRTNGAQCPVARLFPCARQPLGSCACEVRKARA